jgi:hypothetical protein
MPTSIPPATIAPTTGLQIVPPTSAPIPTLASVIVPKHEPTKAPVKKEVTKFDPNKKVPGLNSFVAVKKKQGGFIESILNTIWDAIKSAFNL